MTPPLIPAVKYFVRAMKLADAKKLAKEALEMTSPKDIYALCETFYRDRVKIE
jgi:phosphotransferase system enzyme I (PtsI)